MRKLSYLAIAAIAVASCGQSSSQNTKDSGSVKSDSNKVTTPVTPGVESKYAEVNASLTSFSKFIAGMEHSNANKHSEGAGWKGHAGAVDNEWADLTRRIGKPIADWVSGASLNVENEPNTLFYPFAGGDFYYANLFYPKQDTIIMIGLEPCGSIFNPDSVANLANYYSTLRKTMFFPHKYGFFRTLSMEVDFNQFPLNGTLHTNLFYLARSNYNIHYIEHFNIDASGKIVDVTQGVNVKKSRNYRGYRIGYSAPGSKVVKQLVYMSIDASNDGLKGKYKGYYTWVQSHKKVVTFFKAASYLMHNHLEGAFGMMREYVNAASVRVLQDDSGLPYSYLKKKGWNVKCLGEYTGTISLFATQYQPDLRNAYVEQKPAKLPFMIGYNVSLGNCNLQYITKSK